MTLEEIIRQCGEDSYEWFPDTSWDLFFMAASAAGEAGECVNQAKKARRGTHTSDEVRAKIEEEAIDTLIYLCNIFYILGTNVSEAYSAKRAHNEKRFGGGTQGSGRELRESAPGAAGEG